MDYRTGRSAASTISWGVSAAFFTALTYFASEGFGALGAMGIAVVSFALVFIARRAAFARYDEYHYKRVFSRGATKLVSDFVERVRTCFTMPEFVAAIRDGLERTLDATVVLIKSNTWDVVYASPTNLAADPGLMVVLKRNFRELSEGLAFLDEKYSLTMPSENDRGLFIFAKGYYLFIFSRAIVQADHDVHRIMHAEIQILFDRVLTVSRLFQIAALSKEWRLIAETQRTFLPASLPEQPKLALAAYFRPLVNVSGDYYDAIRVDDDRTLLVMGDVSGKGLGAALVMGIAVNTIRAAVDKVDLAGLIRKCDNAIREMGFEDKYTVLFLGLADVKKKTLRYVNAALPEQFLVVRTVRGPVVRRLESNHGIVGLVDQADVAVEEIELRTDDVLILSTDGLTELENEQGLPLDEAPEFNRLLGEANELDITDLVDRLATLGETYVGGKALRDDITILAAKVGRLWD